MINNGWLMAYHGGHNTSIACFNYKTKELKVFEAEKITGHKHLRMYEEYGGLRWQNIAEELATCMKRNGMPMKFEHICTGLPDGSAARYHFHLEKEDLKRFGISCNTMGPLPGHHWCHAYTNVMFTKHDRGLIWAFDAYGDDGPNQYYTFDRYRDKMVEHIDIYDPEWDDWNEEWFEDRIGDKTLEYRKRKILEQNPGSDYWRKGAYLLGKIVRNTGFTDDLPGKIMGASAFGKTYDRRELQALYLQIRDSYNYQNRRRLIINKQRTKSPFSGNNWMEVQFTQPNDLSFQEECNRAAFIQQSFENQVTDRLESLDMIRRIKEEYDGILLMSGGCSLNVVMNQKLQERYGIKVEVCSIPNDIGIATGMVMRYAFENELISRDTRVDPTYAGPYVSDNCYWFSKERISWADELMAYRNTRRHFIGSANTVARLLREGNIVGMIQGPAECGLRALGARSILCDASYPNMKDKINKVKKREPYRPFAPMCKVEDAPKYFESPHYDNLAHMNINVNVREEYKEKLKSITHVDGTARLQTVDKDNKLVYGLLDAHGGVLLNTSFNVAGKPILNTYIEAFKILEQSEMDYLVVYDHENDMYVIFEPQFEHGY